MNWGRGRAEKILGPEMQYWCGFGRLRPGNFENSLKKDLAGNGSPLSLHPRTQNGLVL